MFLNLEDISIALVFDKRRCSNQWQNIGEWSLWPDFTFSVSCGFSRVCIAMVQKNASAQVWSNSVPSLLLLVYFKWIMTASFMIHDFWFLFWHCDMSISLGLYEGLASRRLVSKHRALAPGRRHRTCFWSRWKACALSTSLSLQILAYQGSRIEIHQFIDDAPYNFRVIII
jgi:hypothetical protein